jgi:transcription-repair coupling factor (superfamily II helicase)
VQQRLAVLCQLRDGLAPNGSAAGGLIVVASVRALLHPTLHPSELWASNTVLQRGMRVDLSGLLRDWLDLGYRPVTVVEEPGQFSRRGGIVDIFPPASEYPTRAELFDDEIDSLRYFDPLTQRSLGPARRVAVAPPTEVPPRMAGAAADALSAADISAMRPEVQEAWRADVDRLRNRQVGRGMEFYAPYFSPVPASLLDHLDGPVFLDSPDLLAETAGDLQAQADELKSQLVERGDLPAGFRRPCFTWDETMALMSQRPVILLEPHAGGRVPDAPTVTAPRVYAGRLKQLLDDCQEWTRQGRRVVLTSHQARRLSALLAERNITSVPLDGIVEAPPAGSITILQGSSSEGWEAGSLTLLSDAEIFGWVRPRRGTRRARPGRDAFLSELKPGDHVVHIEHGVGVFRGLTKMTMEGLEREYLHLDYAAGDRLFVPVDHIDRVSRYIGAGEGRPALTRLSSADWEHAKSRVKTAVQNIAKELLALYAARETAPGYAFSPDTVWQHDLESSFPYLETPDQLAAIEDVKSDMERQRPMDRLICGDVGYGKTEVALRATFKAVMDGKQVAILVPTTILAQQHFITFRERLATYPVRLEVLSRFRSEKEQQKALVGLRDGTVDVVIGTHRLLQKDVGFKDLGLVIIDEEQRFGVAHKERLKQLRREVDVLTLTATPIPRTLHMSLAGVRDMSTIETPPEDRLSIVTIVHEYDDTLVREAILRERDRGGQVFFVHNRVHGIETVATRLQKLVPEATFVVGHGQMQEDDLERVMLDFSEGRFDVLVCTAIIEAGLDIPNANTILINRAHHFGLAQLYQLRGRVGRGANRAYAYFLYDREFQLSETAEKRLDVINEATDLGAGFRVAMKDLEIRGAGNLLGAEQHGHIEAVGFDLYSRLLAQAVAELKELGGDEAPEENAAIHVASMRGPTLDLPLDAFLPTGYVAGEAERLALYQRLATARSLFEVDGLAADLEDRFGKLPPAAENLLYSVRVKVWATAGKVSSIKVTDDAVTVRLGPDALPDRVALAKRFGAALRQPGLHTLRLERTKLGGKWRDPLMKLVTLLPEGRPALAGE